MRIIHNLSFFFRLLSWKGGLSDFALPLHPLPLVPLKWKWWFLSKLTKGWKFPKTFVKIGGSGTEEEPTVIPTEVGITASTHFWLDS